MPTPTDFPTSHDFEMLLREVTRVIHRLRTTVNEYAIEHMSTPEIDDLRMDREYLEKRIAALDIQS